MATACRVLPMNELADAGKPLSVAWLRLTPEAVGVPIGAQETVLDVPWTGVFVINAGHLSVVEKDARRVRSFAMAAASGSRRSKNVAQASGIRLSN